MKRIVELHEVTRHYGGPEEGGWYFDCYAPVLTWRGTRRRQARKVFKRFQALGQASEEEQKDARGRRYGRGSVLGGADYVATISTASQATRGRPRYS